MFPFPAQGHMLPLLQLSHQLALRGFTLTILVTPHNLPFLSSSTSSFIHSPTTNIHTLVLPFPTHPSLPPGVENVSQIGYQGVVPIISALSSLADPIARWFYTHPSPPLAILSDFFLGWTVSLAVRLSIPRIAFFSSGPYFSSLYHLLWLHYCSPASRSSLDACVSFPDLPRSPSFPRHHLPTTFLRYRDSDPDWEVVRSSMLANASSWGCVFNTFHAIEGDYLDHLKRVSYGQGRVYGVGPLSLMGGCRPESRRLCADPKAAMLMTWLDGCPDDGSVLYVCFGSQKLLNRAQMEALASGLERSGSRFVWVVKPGTPEQLGNGYGLVPAGFEDRVKGDRRGVVIKGWAPQVEILNHRAVGWFLSHCGWNSALEAVSAGVVILGWPMEAEQFVNARLLVEELGAGIRLCEGADTVPDSVELGRSIANAMAHPERARVRVKAKQLRKEALAAVGNGGSSLMDLEELVKDLSQFSNG